MALRLDENRRKAYADSKLQILAFIARVVGNLPFAHRLSRQTRI